MKRNKNSDFDLESGTDRSRQILTSNSFILDQCGDRLQTGVPDRNENSLPLQLLLRADLRSRLEETLRRSSGLSMEAILLAAFKILIHRYTDETNNTIQVYPSRLDGPINMLPMRPTPFVLQSEIRPNHSGRDVCRSIWIDLLETRLQDLTPFDTQVEPLKSDRVSEDISLDLLQFSVDANALKLSDILSSTIDSTLDFSIVFTEHRWHIELSYCAKFLKLETLERLLGHYQCLLIEMAQNLDAEISQLPILTEPEKHPILITWNQCDIL